jgi:Protein of unknown function (DUF2384)
MSTRKKACPAPPDAAVVTRAVLKAAEQLKLTNKVLANIIGVSEATVSRMRAGRYALRRGQKPFELAILFGRFHLSLDAIVGGDQTAASAWLKSRNTALGAEPVGLIQTVPGLMDAIHYLDARRRTYAS